MNVPEGFCFYIILWRKVGGLFLKPIYLACHKVQQVDFLQLKTLLLSSERIKKRRNHEDCGTMQNRIICVSYRRSTISKGRRELHRD